MAKRINSVKDANNFSFLICDTKNSNLMRNRNSETLLLASKVRSTPTEDSFGAIGAPSADWNLIQFASGNFEFG
jgi:hypothetical protein